MRQCLVNTYLDLSAPPETRPQAYPAGDTRLPFRPAGGKRRSRAARRGGEKQWLRDCEKCFSNTSGPAPAKTGALKSLAPRTYQAPKYIQYSCLYPEVLPPGNKNRQTGQFCPKADHCRHPGWPSEYLSGLTNFVTPGDEKRQFLIRVKPLIDFPVLRSCPGSFYVGAIRLAPIPPAFWIYSRMSSTFIRRRQE